MTNTLYIPAFSSTLAKWEKLELTIQVLLVFPQEYVADDQPNGLLSTTIDLEQHSFHVLEEIPAIAHNILKILIKLIRY